MLFKRREVEDVWFFKVLGLVLLILLFLYWVVVNVVLCFFKWIKLVVFENLELGWIVFFVLLLDGVIGVVVLILYFCVWDIEWLIVFEEVYFKDLEVKIVFDKE